MSVNNYLNEMLNENEDALISNIDFENEFFNAGLSVERGITEEDVDPNELKMGIEVEMEHTSNTIISRKIAMDHLAEIKDYYTRLAKMEEEAFRDMDSDEI